MTKIETEVCTIAEWMKSNEIDALIAELQMIASRKYDEEEAEQDLIDNIL